MRVLSLTVLLCGVMLAVHGEQVLDPVDIGEMSALSASASGEKAKGKLAAKAAEKPGAAAESDSSTSDDADSATTSQVSTKDSSGASDSGLTGLASKAHAKAEFALNKIKTAKELREKARQVLKAKGKPIPEILQKGALDDVHQRVLDAQEKLSAKFGASSKNDGELEAKVQAKREKEVSPQANAKLNGEVAKSSAEAEAANMKLKAAEAKAAAYKEKYKEEKLKEKATRDAAKVKEQGMQQKAELDKKMQQTEADGKVMELEVKMKEKAKEKMESGPAESEADFNHRQIAQEAYNKQVMGYVMAWEKTHGGPAAGANGAQEQEEIKSDLGKFVDHYEQKHQKIKGDIAVADTPTRKA